MPSTIFSVIGVKLVSEKICAKLHDSLDEKSFPDILLSMKNTIRENTRYEGSVNVTLDYDTIAFEENIKGIVTVSYVYDSGDHLECNDELNFDFVVKSCNYPVNEKLIADIRLTLEETLRDFLIDHIENGKNIEILS